MNDKKLIGFVYNPIVPHAERLVRDVVDGLNLADSCWITSTKDTAISTDRLECTSIVVTFGGDGSILKVARLLAAHSVPILGINLGRVGFMTELSVGQAKSQIKTYLDGNPRVDERMMLQATVGTGVGEARVVAHALNDVVLTRGVSTGLIDIATRIDDVLLTTYRADGLIAATPTGSTGYSLSAGGPILHPEAQDILIQPVAAHMSFQTGIVIPSDSVICLDVNGEARSVLSVDGFSNIMVEPGEVVIVKKSPYTTQFLRNSAASTFYSTLTQRLGMSGRQVPPQPDE